MEDPHARPRGGYLIKDKVKPIKIVTDDSNIPVQNDADIIQCPYCKKLHNKKIEHTCPRSQGRWEGFVCSLCGIKLDSESKRRHKTHISNGRKYTTIRFKKSYHWIDSTICWNCAFNITKMFTNDLKGKK